MYPANSVALFVPVSWSLFPYWPSAMIKLCKLCTSKSTYLWWDNTFAVCAEICLESCTPATGHAWTMKTTSHSLSMYLINRTCTSAHQIKATLITGCYKVCYCRVMWHFLIALSTSSKGDQSLILDWWQKVGGIRWSVCSMSHSL